MKFLLLYLDRYLFSVVIENRYVPGGSKQKYRPTFYYYYWEHNYVQIGSVSSNYTICGFCHASLNSVTSI